MRKLTHATKIAAALGLLALLLAVSAFTFAPSKAFAATTHASSTQHSITSVKLISSNVPTPLCPGTSVWWSSGPTSITHGVDGWWTFAWNCAGNSNSQAWIVDWRDGGNNTYWCIAYPGGNGCGTGSFTVDHTYYGAGTYIAKVYNANNSAIAAWYTITVH